MHSYGWNYRVKMKKRTEVGQPCKIVGNHLNRKISSNNKFKKLVADMIYLPLGRKQLYLSSIMDVCNDEIIAFVLDILV